MHSKEHGHRVAEEDGRSFKEVQNAGHGYGRMSVSGNISRFFMPIRYFYGTRVGFLRRSGDAKTN